MIIVNLEHYVPGLVRKSIKEKKNAMPFGLDLNSENSLAGTAFYRQTNEEQVDRESYNYGISLLYSD